jgi:hypothetical protein
MESKKRRQVIGSNVQIGSDNFKDRPVTNVANAIDGAAQVFKSP